MDNRMTITKNEKKNNSITVLRLIDNTSHEKTWMFLMKGIFERKTKYMPIATQNNTVRTNQIKVRINKTQ